MNATQNRPDTTKRSEHQNLVVRIHKIRQLITSGTGLDAALAELESLVPLVSSYAATESLAGQDWEISERNRLEEGISEIRSKVRELQALLDSGKRLIEDGLDSESVELRSEALNAYLLPTLTDTNEALEVLQELRSEALSAVTES